MKKSYINPQIEVLSLSGVLISVHFRAIILPALSNPRRSPRLGFLNYFLFSLAYVIFLLYLCSRKGFERIIFNQIDI